MNLDTATLALGGAVALAGTVAYLRSAPEPDIHPAHLRSQSDIARTRVQGETAIIRNRGTPNGVPLLRTSSKGDCLTVYELFQSSLKNNSGKPYLGHRVGAGPYEWITYDQVAVRATNLGSGLCAVAGLKPGSSDNVGICLQNSPAWLVTDLSCASYSLVSVPLYETFDQNSLEYIINLTEMKIVVSSSKNLDRIFELLKKCPQLKAIVVTDAETVSADLVQRAAEDSAKILTLAEVEKIGAGNQLPHVPPKPSDVFTICFTSGTTGSPKGVIGLHSNAVACIFGIVETFPKELALTDQDRHLSFLPLAHNLERALTYAFTYYGMQIGFYRGSIPQLFDDFEACQPTVFPAVPRLLIRLYDRVKLQISQSSPIVKILFDFAYAQKLSLLQSGCVRRDTIWDKIVFKNIQNKLGGRIRLMLTGSAPISPKVLEFLRITLGCPIMEGYGLTELFAGGCVTMVYDHLQPFGAHVGVPFLCNEAKLVDVADLGYRVDDQPNPRGELCFRGNAVTPGYYKSPELTAAAFDENGWFHTGDVGELLPNGTIKIIDRVKNLFKLSQGEYVAPEKVENAIKNKFIGQVWIHGDSLESYLIAVVVPEPDTVLTWAKHNGLEGKSMAELCETEALNKLIMDSIVESAKEHALKSFETPRRIHLHPDLMTPENGLLTPTLKLKRNVLKTHFKTVTDKLYGRAK
ncbi:long-chain-fatty-acid--CoA ligase 5 [Polychytrium aggregatum]|uniref:long-chain-fatty-acid--CoA ligase 5 n=1 Tax=Polychytrium aggregatum TaxID=110093 RepID=UPI0022FF36F8|nr:long-chain-fatty-acid--CoA ligase 5 [Polychytrium aggregatum]KAI9203795.1 long-chain-fatty-acid--CoA ligase 5 [Polychytrium aggregatum]